MFKKIQIDNLFFHFIFLQVKLNIIAHIMMTYKHVTFDLIFGMTLLPWLQ